MLFKPTVKKDRITDITVEDIKNLGVDTLILDVDNTLSTHHSQILTDGLENWLSAVHSAGIKTVIVSNSKRERVEPFAKIIEMDFIPMGLKPLPSGFRKAVKLAKSEKKKTAAVGDQIFTDILGANLFGIKSFLLSPILPEPQLRFRIKRKLEKIFYKKYGW